MTLEPCCPQLAAKRPTTPLTARDEQLQRYPLVRLKVDYSGYSTCNPQKFGQRFVDKVCADGGRGETRVRHRAGGGSDARAARVEDRAHEL